MLHPDLQEIWIEHEANKRAQDEIDAWKHEEHLRREEALYRAMTECQEKGVSLESLKILQRETGIAWDPNFNHTK